MNTEHTEISPLTEAIFTNAVRRTVFLLVEGGSDRKFWLSRVDQAHCEIWVMGSRDKALDKMRSARQEHNQALIAILDADFDRFEGRLQEIEGVFWTDQHDLEGMLIASPALQKILAEFCSHDRRKPAHEVRRHLMEQALSMAKLRLVSKRKDLGLSFRKIKGDTIETIKYQKFCPEESWTVEFRALIQEVINYSQKHHLKAETLEHYCHDIQAKSEADREQLCNGHDLIGILAIGFAKNLGSKRVDPERLGEALRLAFELRDLQKTGLAQSLSAWESAHPGFRILRAA